MLILWDCWSFGLHMGRTTRGSELDIAQISDSFHRGSFPAIFLGPTRVDLAEYLNSPGYKKFRKPALFAAAAVEAGRNGDTG